ncbi:hypothetical protein AOL_s00097g302 [Orbilia oligospora ATCC 24927]|uniref:CBM-cenC domain-containing protein n=1 Tax=Arthrobotrys oligospora (strain ATCC 24927 / CBS 115.81 / DSM 1491) TaxID=756982 RepID=G1XIX5_ARTOA|nr:hypothetical protein AOL_s00097g302 [Orbilia oligospora ATCC 24927]EGX46876.1 hypothetical protein AOL_s00097g302 [Orbilia oligospora ATCC 24927]
MKKTVIPLITLFGAILGSPLDHVKRGCNANNCLRAVRATGRESIGLRYCSDFLGIRPDYTTATEIDFTVTFGEETFYETTITETITRTTGTVETTITAAPFRRRDHDWDPEADEAYLKGRSNILQKCSTDDAKITSACRCFLSDRPVSTETITDYTWVVETVPTLTDTFIATETVSVEAQVTYLPIIKNPGFDDPVDPFRDWEIYDTGFGCSACTHEVAPNAGSSSSPNSLKAIWVDSLGVFRFQQKVQLQLGKWYKFKFEYRVESPSMPQAFIAFELARAYPGVVIGATNQWQTAESVPIMADEWNSSDALLSIWFFLLGGVSGRTEPFYFDSFKIWEVEAPPQDSE